MRIAIASFFLLALFSTTSFASPIVVTFEQANGDVILGGGGLSGDQFHLNNNTETWQEAGVVVGLVTNSHAHIHSAYGPPNSFQIHSNYGMTVDMGGATFSLSSFDTNYVALNTILTASNGNVFNIAATGVTTTNWVLPAGFSNITSFTISNPGEFDIDNIVLNATVPEPASIAIWSALGVAGLFGARRRRKAQA